MRRAIDPTELILLRSERIVGSHLLVTDPFDASTLSRLAAALNDVRITALCRDYRTYQAARRIETDRLRTIFGVVVDDLAADIDSALLYMPKGKELLSLTLDWLSARLPEGSRLYLAGDKHSGVGSTPKMMPPAFGKPVKLDSARHCLLFEATRQGQPQPYDLQSNIQWLGVEFDGCALETAQIPGVFSYGRIDDGSAALINNWQIETPRTALDIGCGCGLLGGLIARRFPSCQVCVTDVSAPAVKAAELTIDRNGLANARCHPSDLFGEVEGHYDVIVSNPPFHTGHDTDRSVVKQLVHGAAEHLSKDGSLQIVGNRFLPYRELLSRRFGYVKTLSEDGRYGVLLAREPKRA